MHEHFELIEIGQTDFVVLMALPEDVLRGGPLPLAIFALASVTADKVCGAQPIWRSHASADDTLK